MTESIAILGSTGSIGRSTLKVCGQLGLSVVSISGGSNIELLEKQAREYKPKIVAISTEPLARELKVRLGDTFCKVTHGVQGMTDCACADGADTLMCASSGTVALAPTLAAIDENRKIALANKETLVCAGEIVMNRNKKCEIIPVDSEHSAIFQCLLPGGAPRKIYLTASGGAFRDFPKDQLKNVTPEMALKHPNWSMGKKITVDSATLMNKGLEFIEAMHLFNLKSGQIEVIVHKESIIHSMVEFCDGAVIAQIGPPDMRLPIQYALTYPNRLESQAEPVDFLKLGSLSFEEPDYENFPCLSLCIAAARTGGTAPAVLTAANDVAAALFLDGKIGFSDIYELISQALENIKLIKSPALGDIYAALQETTDFTVERARKCSLR